MDFGYTPEQEALRREVRAFIAEHVTDEVLAERGSSESNTGRGESGAMKELYQKIYDRGWLGIIYPKEYGGQGGNRMGGLERREDPLRPGRGLHRRHGLTVRCRRDLDPAASASAASWGPTPG